MNRRLLALLCVFGAALLAACSQSGADDELLVFAATSLTDAMTEAATAFEATSGTEVEISFGPSRALAQQIVRGATPDLYFAAGQPPMDSLLEGGQVDGDGVVRLLSNKIVLITGQDGPAISGINELANAGFTRIAMPDPEIAPAGNYTRAALQNLGLVGTNAAEPGVRQRCAGDAVVCADGQCGWRVPIHDGCRNRRRCCRA